MESQTQPRLRSQTSVKRQNALRRSNAAAVADGDQVRKGSKNIRKPTKDHDHNQGPRYYGCLLFLLSHLVAMIFIYVVDPYSVPKPVSSDVPGMNSIVVLILLPVLL